MAQKTQKVYCGLAGRTLHWTDSWTRARALHSTPTTQNPTPDTRNSGLKTRNLKIARLVPLLLDWYSRQARDLPWRRTRDPYAIWVSEIMLQQTQVKTVLPYWRRWMRELPTIQALAKARTGKLHKLWEGLGYYSRVRNMRQAARRVIENHGGRFPDAFESVLALPGIGPYTAGAICSIAFGQPTPALDGNVIRVLTRLFGVTGDPREKQTNAFLWQLAEKLALRSSGLDQVSGAGREVPGAKCQVPGVTKHGARITEHASGNTHSACSHLNQSLMELGALICTPRRARCDLCPVARHCVALRQDRVDQLPRRPRRAPQTARRFAAFVLERRGRFLVRQRPDGAVNARLWEFPNTELNAAGSDLSRAARRLLGFTPQSFDNLCVVRHSITRYRILLEAFWLRDGHRGGPARIAGRWLTRSQLTRLAFPSAHQKILRRLPRGGSRRKAATC
jgi:A/G-specific adenine glycosylase